MSIDPENFREAARRVERGWTQHTLYRYDWLAKEHQVCLMGSLLKSPHYHSNIDQVPYEARAILKRALRRYPSFWGGHITLWNDAPWRRKSKVVKVLKRAAKIAARDWQPPPPVPSPKYGPGVPILIELVEAETIEATVTVETKELVSGVTEWVRCYAREDLGVHLPRPWVFLAGPTPRDADTPSWRPEMLEAFDDRAKMLTIGGTLIVPENRVEGTFDGTTFDDQVAWEWKGLEQADAILFWVARNMETLPGLTTNIEFGMYWDSGRVVVGVVRRSRARWLLREAR